MVAMNSHSSGERDERQDVSSIEKAVHHIGIHIAEILVRERPGQRSDDREAELLPERDSRAVGAHDEVELHRQVTRLPGRAQAMQPHRPSDAFAAVSGIDHERSIGDMRAEVALIGNELVHPDDAAGVFGDMRDDSRREPVCECVLEAGLRSKDIGRARAHHLLEDRPHGGEVGFDG